MTSSRTASLFLAILAGISTLVLCAPVQADLNVEENQSPDGYLDSVVIENDWIGAEISSMGGKLTRLYDRRTGREFAAQPDTIMQGIGKRRDWVTGLGELLTAPHTLEVQRAGDGVTVEASYEASTGNFAGLEFTVSYELAADRPALNVTNSVQSISGETTFDLNLHNLLSLEAFSPGSTYIYAGSADGPVRVSLTQAQSNKNNLIYNIAEPWIAIGDRNSREGLALIPHDRAGLENFYFWSGENTATLEWIYGRTSLAPRAERDQWSATYSIVPINGLGTILGANRSLIYSVDRAEQGGRGQLGLFSPAGAASARVTLSHEGSELVSREVALSSDEATQVRFPLPDEAGVHEIDAVVETPGATVEFTAPVAVEAERSFANVTTEIRRPKVEGVNGFYYYFDELSLSSDVTATFGFGLRGDFPSNGDLRLVLEVPAGVEIDTEYEGINSNDRDMSRRVSEIEVDGKPYLRYELPSRRSSTYYRAMNLFGSIEGDAEDGSPVYYYAKWDDGEQARQTLSLNVVSVEPTPNLEHIRVGFELGGSRSVENYDNLVHSFNRAGLNYIAAGITSWALGVEPRKEVGAYRDMIEPIEQAGIHVSTGNLGYPLGRYHQIWENRYGTYDIAGTLHYPETEFKDFDVEDTKAVNIDGEKIGQMCPSYRGRMFEKTLDDVRLLIDYGYTTLLYDEETWSNAREICYCERCRSRFAEFLESEYPDLEQMDPRKITPARDQYPDHYDAWWDFRTEMVAEIYRRMKEVAVDHGGPDIEIGTYVSASVGGGQYYGGITHRLTDFRKVAEGADFELPMAYTTSLRDSRRIGRVAGFLWEKVGSRAQPFMALSPARTYEYERVARNDLPPAVAVKYQMFEAFSQGTEGILIWAPSSGLEAAQSMRHMSDAIRAIAPVEDIIVHGELIEDPRTTNRRVHARGIQHEGRAVLLVAEYSNSIVTTGVEYQADTPRTVVDLETGEPVGTVGPNDSTFEVTLDDRRARLLLIE